MSQYEAAVELCRALDTYRVLVRAGRVTGADINRVDAATARFTGRPYHGPVSRRGSVKR